MMNKGISTMKFKTFICLNLFAMGLIQPVQAAPLFFDRTLIPLSEADRLYIDEIHINPKALGVDGFIQENAYGLSKQELVKLFKNGYGYDDIKLKPTQVKGSQILEVRNNNAIFSSYLFVLENNIVTGFVLADTPFIRDANHPKSPIPSIFQYPQDQYIQLSGLPQNITYTSHVREDNGFIERFVLLHVPGGNNPGYGIQRGTGLSLTFILLSSYYPRSLDQELQSYQNEEVQKRLESLKTAELEIIEYRK
jgi:hypothetical protein